MHRGRRFRASDGFESKDSMIGSENPSVFPVPVLAPIPHQRRRCRAPILPPVQILVLTLVPTLAPIPTRGAGTSSAKVSPHR